MENTILGFVFIITVVIPIFLLFLTAIIQVFLSLKKIKILGLIIPTILFLIIVYITVITVINYNPTAASFPLHRLIFINAIKYLMPFIINIIIYLVCLLVKKKKAE